MDDSFLAPAAPQLPHPPPTGVDPAAFTLAYLQSHEAECPACGYNVHRIPEPRCPECGRKIALQVVMAEGGYRTAWVVALISFGLSAGIGLLLLAVVIQEGMPPRRSDLRTVGIWIVILFFLSNIPLPLFLLILRRWFIRMPGILQWSIALITALATLSMTILFLGLLNR